MATTQSETITELRRDLFKTYREEFPNEEPNIVAFAPGRVNLIGEHVDYNDGFVFPMAIPLGTMIVGEPIDSTDRQICYIKTLSKDVDDPKSIQVDLSEPLKRVSSPVWANYVIGVLALFLEKIPDEKKRAFRAIIATSVPIGGGLSSSASIEVAMCTFLESLYSNVKGKDLPLSKVDKALLCCQAERTYANVPGGIMDQYTSCMAQSGHALLIDCRDKTCQLFPMKDENVCVLVANSNVKHELVDGTYAQRVRDCHEAAKALGYASLREVPSIDELEKIRDKISDVVYRRARHAITEIARTERATQVLVKNNYEEFGRLMNESHQSLKDDFEVSCSELDQLVELARSVDGVYGSRMTGAGFGGCTVTLVKKSAVNACIQAMEKGYQGKATFYQFVPSSGAHLVESN